MAGAAIYGFQDLDLSILSYNGNHSRSGLTVVPWGSISTSPVVLVLHPPTRHTQSGLPQFHEKGIACRLACQLDSSEQGRGGNLNPACLSRGHDRATVAVLDNE